MAKWQTPFEPEAILGEPDKSNWALAVHCALLPVGGALGSVLHFCGNRWDDKNHAHGLVNHTALIDYQTRAVTRPSSPIGPGGLPPTMFLDLFCCGHALLPDGRLLVGGGTSMMTIQSRSNPHHGHFGGLRECWIFDANAFDTPKWVPIASMNYAPPQSSKQGGGRWYPTLQTLADGSVIALCGHPRIYPSTAAIDTTNPTTGAIDHTPIDEYISTEPVPPGCPVDDLRHNNNTPEVYNLTFKTWNMAPPLGEGLNGDWAVFYPRLHVLPSGELLIVQPLYSDQFNDETRSAPQLRLQSLVYNVLSQSVTAYFPGPQTHDAEYVIHDTRAQYTSSVLLPLLPENNFTARVMLCGAEQPVIATIQATAQSIGSWKPTAVRQMTGPRYHCNATLLPTGEVFVNGGMKDASITGPGSDATNGQSVPEIFDPDTGAGFDLRLMSWGAGSGVPTSGNNLVIVGTDNNGLLHIRIFDAGGNLVTDTDETKLASTQAGAISTLKQQLPGLLPPRMLTGAEKAQVITEATSIAGQTPGAWRALTATPARVPRGYHSTALLMADGRVWTAGSEIDNTFGANYAEFRVEIFEPDYIAVPDRVEITGCPPSVAYGHSFSVTYETYRGDTTISRVAMTRLGSATHGFNGDQRYVGLEFTDLGNWTLNLTAPVAGNLAPPGYYMLWLIDSNNLPCQKAAFVRLYDGGPPVIPI